MLYNGQWTLLGLRCDDLKVIERESAKAGLAVNESKIKYMLSTRRDVRRVESHIMA